MKIQHVAMNRNELERDIRAHLGKGLTLISRHMDEDRREAEIYNDCIDKLRPVMTEIDESPNHARCHDLVHELAGMRENCLIRIEESKNSLNEINEHLQRLDAGDLDTVIEALGGGEMGISQVQNGGNGNSQIVH